MEKKSKVRMIDCTVGVGTVTSCWVNTLSWMERVHQSPFSSDQTTRAT